MVLFSVPNVFAFASACEDQGSFIRLGYLRRLTDANSFKQTFLHKIKEMPIKLNPNRDQYERDREVK
jgi:hypothetical protein